MTANEYAKLAIKWSQDADAIKPADGDPEAQVRSLIVFHLRSAAKLARETAEHKARNIVEAAAAERP